MKESEVKSSKHFCMIPWTHMHIWPKGQVHLCCASDSTKQHLGQLSNEVTLKDIWNSSRMINIRLEMLKDNPIEECSRCYELELNGIQSMRQEQNKAFIHHFDKVIETATDGSLAKLNMPYMDIRFSNICNLRCRTCGPELSSKWFKDALALNMSVDHSSALVYPTEDPSVL
jgi:radical SAM protein with 4Fe4S-binding SPASM domain